MEESKGPFHLEDIVQMKRNPIRAAINKDPKDRHGKKGTVIGLSYETGEQTVRVEWVPNDSWFYAWFQLDLVHCPHTE